MSSSPVEAGQPVEGRESGDSSEPVELFLIGRTLRGTLGEAFRREAISRFENIHDSGADARPPFSALSRTVELTAVAVTRAGPVQVDLGIADPSFRSSSGAPAERDAEGETLYEVAVDELAGIRPLPGPPGVDLSRTAVVRVQRERSAAPLDFRVSVLPTD